MDTNINFVFKADPSGAVGAANQTADAFKRIGNEAQTTSAKSKTAAESFQSNWVSASAKATAALELEAQAFKRLGVTSTAELQKMADQAKQAYAIIQTSGSTSAGDVLRAQKASIEAQIALYKGMAQQVPAELEKQFSSVKQSLGEASSASSAFGNSLGSLKTIAIGVVGTFGAMAIANQIREWITAASDFQREFANVKTLFDESKVNADAMRKEVLSLSGALGSSVDLTKGLYEALSAGIAPANAVKFVGEAAMFAKAALVDTRTAVDVLTTTINAYGMKATDAAKISDILFTTIKLGKITGQELSASLGQVIASAATTGVKFEELNAAIASLTSGGIKGSEAITALRAIISNVGKPTEDASKAADKLGINFSLAGLKSQGLSGFLAELTEKAKGNTQAQVDLFGSVQAFNAIAILTSDQGMKRFNDAMIELQNSAGATTVAFEKQNDTVGAQSEALWNNLSKLFTKAAGEGRSLTDVLKGLNTVLESKTWGDAYRNFNLLTIQLGFMGKAAKQALSDAQDHKVMMDAQTGATKRGFDAMHNYALSLLEAGKAQDKAVGEKTAKQLEEQAKSAEKAAQAAGKVRSEMDKLSKQYATVTGAAMLHIAQIKEDIKFMEQHRGSTDALSGAREKLGQKTFELIAIQAKHPELLKKTEVAHQTTTVAMLGEMTAVEKLTMAYERYLGTVKAFAEIDLDSVMISNNATLDEAFKRVEDGTRSWEKLNKEIKTKTPEALAPAKQSFEDMGRQVSTVVTDLGKGIADALIKWQGFGKSMINVAKEFGSGILRTLIETWFKPLEDMLQKMAKKISSAFSGLFGGGLLGSLGGLGIVAGATAGITALINKFTQRGKDKTAATGPAEDLSANVWQGIIPDVKAGNLSIAEGVTAVNAAWAAYEAFLRANLKDSVVIQRSLDTQRGTLTQSLAELNAMKAQMGTEGMASLRGFLDEMARTGTVTDEAIAGLKGVVEQMEFAGLEAETNAAKLGLLGAEFFQTGKMTDEFADALKAAGGSADFFTTLTGQIKHLQGLRSELGSLKQMVDSFLPKQKTWMENFMATGEITDEMAQKIREAGGDIEDFKKFAEMKGVKSQFESLVEEFEKTGEASEDLLKMIKQFGGPAAVKAFETLMDEAKASGKTIGELAKDSEGSAKSIQDAFAATSEGINKAFGDAAKNLSDTLAKMDENLGKAIGDLQTAMVTMIGNLIDVILGVPGAAEKAARDTNFFLGGIKAPEIRINISTHFDDSGLREAERRAAALAGMNFTPQPGTNTTGAGVSGGSGIFSGQQPIDPRIPRFQHGTDYVPRTGLAMLHQGEAVIPAGQNTGSTQGGGNEIHLHFDFSGVVDREGMKRMVREHVAPELASVMKGNTGGSRVAIKKALQLKQPGAF